MHFKLVYDWHQLHESIYFEAVYILVQQPASGQAIPAGHGITQCTAKCQSVSLLQLLKQHDLALLMCMLTTSAHRLVKDDIELAQDHGKDMTRGTTAEALLVQVSK